MAFLWNFIKHSLQQHIKHTEDSYNSSQVITNRVSLKPMVFLARYMKLFTSVLARRLSNTT